MGSTSWSRDVYKSVKQELDDYYGRGGDGTNHIIRSRLKGGAYYAVCRSFNNDGVVFAIAAPYGTYMEGGYPYIWAKDQDESCGPYHHDFPVKWLDLLTEPVNDYSREWRERVRALAEKAKPVIRDGDIIRFKEPLKFTDGTEHTELRAYRRGRQGRALRFSPVALSYPAYRITRDALKYREWEVVS